MNKVN